MTGCRAAQQLAAAAGPAWTVRTRDATGVTEKTALGEPRGDGTRPRITVRVPCRSVGVRLRGPAGQRASAMWSSIDSGASWRHEGAWTWTPNNPPRAVSVTDVRTVIALPWAAKDEETS